MIFRLATPADAPGLLEIYAPFCRETAVSFETEPPAPEEMERRIAVTTAILPWIVAEDGGVIQGYAYASKHRERAGYRWSVDVSVYLRQGARGIGLGRGLYTALFGVLERLGYQNAVAGVTLPNPASIGLHRAMGFRRVGVYPGIGYKCGSWHDVEWLQRPLGRHEAHPGEPLAIGEILGTPAWNRALAEGQALVRAAGFARGS